MPSSISRGRRVKRPSVLAKKFQLRQKSYNNSRNIWFEKFKAIKANNIALARALSKEKQESQCLFTQNVDLTSQLQDMGVSVNNRDEILSGILKNSTEALKLIVQVTNYVTSTIVACQTVIGKSQSINSHTSLSSNTITSTRRESMRQSSGKSPARGVVQPMVSGHTITKPVINLSRINMPRIQTSPNLTIINESSDDSTGERSPLGNENHTPRRISINRLNGITNRRVKGLLPERIRLSSSRMSDENEQMPESQDRRLSHISRHSRRTSRKSDQQQSLLNESSSLINGNSQNTIKTPRVTLQDVSRLLQNSHSINIRTLMESSEISFLQENENTRDTTAINSSNNIVVEATQDNEKIGKNFSPMTESPYSSPTYNFDPRKKKELKSKDNKSEDPLEGPSWLYNSSESTDLSGQNKVPEAPEFIVTSNESNLDVENISNSRQWDETELSKLNTANTINTSNTTNESSACSKTEWGETYCAYTSNIIDIENNTSDNNDNMNVNDTEDDSDRCENLTNIVSSYNYKNDDNEAFVNSKFIQSSNNVTRRGHSEIDDDDFTMMLNPKPKQKVRNMNFDIDELNLPVLERPLINPVDVEPEPEITTTIKMITQTYHRMPSMARDNMDTSLLENRTSVLIPVIRESTIRTSSDIDINITRNTIGNTDSDDTSSFLNNSSIRKRKRVIRNRIDSSSDSELSITPEKVLTSKRKNIRKKDPSTATVVLEKLEDINCKKTLSSFNLRSSSNNILINSMQSDAQSDSESSNASSMMSSGRPRRQKAPINLKEPKLGTKLRRW